VSGSPVFYIYRKEALEEPREALAGRYKIRIRRDLGGYGTSTSSNLKDVRTIFEQAREEFDP